VRKLLTIIIIAALAWGLYKVVKDFDYKKTFTCDSVLDNAMNKLEKGK